jgi:hypothetical protein
MFMAALTAFRDVTNFGRSAIYAAPALTGESAVHVANVEHYRALCAENGAPAAQAVRDIFGNPFRPITFSPAWRTDTAISLAKQMHESRDFSAMPILADALQDAGCDDEDILDHCRDTTVPHVRVCWVVDLVLSRV